VLSSATASGVVWWRSFFDDLARDSNVGGDAAAPLDGVDGGGLLVGTEVARGATRQAAVSASTTPQTASVAMVAMFIPIASLVS